MTLVICYNMNIINLWRIILEKDLSEIKRCPWIDVLSYVFHGDVMNKYDLETNGRLTCLIILLSLLLSIIPAVASDLQVIGAWDNSIGNERYQIIIGKNDKEIILVKKFKSGVTIKQAMNESKGSDGMVYRSKDKEAELYYIIDKKGRLQVWDLFGLKTTLNIDK